MAVFKAARHRISFEGRIYLLALFAGLPGSIVAMVLLWTGRFPTEVQWTVTILIFATWFFLAAKVREKIVYPLRTFSNLLAAMREGDFSVRARDADIEDAFGEVLLQVNAMGQTLQEQRLSALDATNLLRKVLEEIDVAIFAFDGNRLLRLVNRAGERLLQDHSKRITGLTAEAVGLSEYLDREQFFVIRSTFPGGTGQWGVRRTEFRERGIQHQLLVIADLTRPLREEELLAWQRLVRVLGHEINNSLTPLKSIAASLTQIVQRDALPPDWRDDMLSGLNVIGTRSESLGRFIGSYARLARLPQPRFESVNVNDWVRRVSAMDTRIAVNVEPGPDCTIPGDPDQLEQMLINLIQNAVDASLDSGGQVTVRWIVRRQEVEIIVEDEGPGLANEANLFVPFFTTKPNGSGVGLVLSRQIAEAHGGTLVLRNRQEGTGCEASFRLHV
jgi:two-component system, NtrC family, nitrogen regulation sensor histidine kinase NtrY